MGGLCWQMRMDKEGENSQIWGVLVRINDEWMVVKIDFRGLIHRGRWRSVAYNESRSMEDWLRRTSRVCFAVFDVSMENPGKMCVIDLKLRGWLGGPKWT